MPRSSPATASTGPARGPTPASRPATATTRTPSTPCSGLNAASEVGVPVKPEVWALARRYWEQYQHNDGGWGYTPDTAMPATASMTCAGISSLIITGLKRFQGQEFLVGDQIQNCGKGGDQHQPPARHRLAGQPLPGG